ncbi:RNA polymerase sporulation sigma factor SigK [Christensenellaceae bacterium NSJ-44]|uniref:RNA polymerase sporulation sigma factor SigK n=2 Tax=Luoshenia tenuis TaxID=2763654 RepID=A0A926HMS1_9FIRM|nr:RNA polymerase sporulation sigma factor SigK [Luoshenia tenuis]
MSEEFSMLLSLLISALQQVGFFVGHISANAFPQPLSPEEERACLIAMQKGDIEARNRLIETNLRLVAHISKKYTVQGYDSEDLISIGTVGLIKAVMTFNPDKKVQLATYAARCIENEVLMSMRSSKKYRDDISLQEPVGSDRQKDEISLLDILGSDRDNVFDDVELRIQSQALYDHISKCLTERERIVITLRYGLMGSKPLPQREVAKKLNISRSYVSRIEKKALEKLQQAFEKNSDSFLC